MGGGGFAPLRQRGAGLHFGAGFGPAPLRQRGAGFHFGAGFGTLHCGRLVLRWSRRALRALSSFHLRTSQPHSTRLRHRLRSTQPRAASFRAPTPPPTFHPAPRSLIPLHHPLPLLYALPSLHSTMPAIYICNHYICNRYICNRYNRTDFTRSVYNRTDFTR